MPALAPGCGASPAQKITRNRNAVSLFVPAFPCTIVAKVKFWERGMDSEERKAMKVTAVRLTTTSVPAIHASFFRRKWAERTLTPIRKDAAYEIILSIQTERNARVPAVPESYSIRSTVRNSVVCGRDANGLLYGVGRLLRRIRFGACSIDMPIGNEFSSPATRDRGVYFATHFNNWYECAPIAKVEDYVAEMALWGYNRLWFWFDMNWYPYGFWKYPTSRGARMIARLRRIKDVARRYGMRVGCGGVANEAFKHQPPKRLLADIAARRGSWYPYSTVCPSKRGGLEMILEDRRIVLDLLGPIDFYVHWPYDSGGCGCAECSEQVDAGKQRWGRKFLELGPILAQEVKVRNPQAQIIVSTWLMDDVERGMVYDLCEKGTDWFDGILLHTTHASERAVPPPYTREVFPEISMFDCFFTSYGCNGANPAPERFARQARDTVAAGCGASLYSEGMYEDANKAIWAGLLWKPERPTGDIAAEYSRWYFGAGNETRGARLIRSLEMTWGAKKLGQTSLWYARKLLADADSLLPALPKSTACRDRWQAIRDRAEMDVLMVQIGPDRDLLRDVRLFAEEASYTADFVALRGKACALCARLEHRLALVEQLFESHWRYLKRFNTNSTVLLFTPDAYLGKQDFRPLRNMLRRAVKIKGGERMRDEIVKGYKRWLWFNSISFDYLFL